MEKQLTNLGKRAFSDCEKWADYIVSVTNVPRKEGVAKLAIAFDMGSTYTRSRVFDSVNSTIGDEKQINSDILTVSNIENIRSKSETLFNNLEFLIKDITEPSLKTNKMFDEVHFVKGALMKEVSGVPMTRPSKVPKTRLLSTYLNTIAMSAMEILFQEQGKKMNKGCYHVDIAMTLPPSEFENMTNISSFKNNLAGHYKVSLPRLGVTINIKISSDAIYLEKEPNAVLYSLANDRDELLEVTSIGLDGGGKSDDIAFLYEGRINDDVAFTGEFGGNKLIDNITKSYCKRTGKSKPSKEAVEAALANGVLLRAGRREDISEDIRQEKNKMAQLIFNDVSNVLDNADTSFEDVEYISFHGRLYRDTVLENGEVLSIREMLMKIIATSVGADSTPKCLVVTEDSVITRGVILSLWVNN